MSAFLAMAYEDRIQLLTDGSAIDWQTGKLRAVVEKVWRSSKQPLAVTGRGNWHSVEKLGKWTADLADELGSIDATIDTVGSMLKRLAHKADIGLFDILITAWSETAGPKLLSFGSHDKSPGFPPFVLHDMGGNALGGPAPTREAIQAFATVPVTDPTFFDLHGAEVFDWMRRQPTEVNLYDPGDLTGYNIGGHAQLTTVTVKGATTKTLRTYDDQEGSRINPFSADGSVVPIVHASKQPNRQMRLATKALEMKRASNARKVGRR